MADPLASMSSYFTPTVLFCFLNFMIATIFISSNFKSHHKHRTLENQHGDDDNPHYPTQLVRAPSFLDRVRSINFSLYRSDSLDQLQPQTHHAHPLQTQIVRAPSILERVRSFNFSRYGSELQSDTHRTDPVQPQLVRVPSLLERVWSSNFSHYGSESQPVTHRADPVKPKLVRAPSVLERVRSVKFSHHGSYSHDPVQTETHQADPVQPQLARAPPAFERVEPFDFSLYGYDHPDPTHHSHLDTDQDQDHDHDHHVTRTKSDTSGNNHPAAVAGARMKKSASEKLSADTAAAEEAEELDRRRPATVREGKHTAWFGDDEDSEEVDSKADDFINKFKQQLKLQRMDSLLRYKEMLGRGAGKWRAS